jgi:uncharacterized protein YmfQ (DUF2313 family)
LLAHVSRTAHELQKELSPPSLIEVPFDWQRYSAVGCEIETTTILTRAAP